MLTVFGIKQCDTCRKALKWLSEKSIEHVFHDLRVDGLTTDMIQGWLQSVDISVLLNKRSTTWKQLSDAQRENGDYAALMLEHPTLIKRPVFDDGVNVLIGFKSDVQDQLA